MTKIKTQRIASGMPEPVGSRPSCENRISNLPPGCPFFVRSKPIKGDILMIYYTADLHLNHQAVIRYCNRPFETVEEMNETIVSNWNKTVNKNDDVYIVGDVIFKLKSDMPLYLDRMNGTKHLITGNHDKQTLKKKQFTEQFASIDEYLVIDDQNRKVVLFHYPIIEWDGCFRGAYHIYGHIHNSNNTANMVMKTIPNAFNAGVDLNDFSPQTLSQLIERNTRPQYSY